MYNLLFIPFNVISKKAAAWFLITPSFGTQSVDQPVTMVDHNHHILDPTIHYIKGFRLCAMYT